MATGGGSEGHSYSPPSKFALPTQSHGLADIAMPRAGALPSFIFSPMQEKWLHSAPHGHDHGPRQAFRGEPRGKHGYGRILRR
jgi:hypothetical protein